VGKKEPPYEEQSKGQCAGASWRRPVVHSAAAFAADDRGHRPQPPRVVQFQQVGINALKELFEMDAVEMVGPKGLHRIERSHIAGGPRRSRCRSVVGG